MKVVPLYAIAHARSGDKGDGSNVGVLAYDELVRGLVDAFAVNAGVDARERENEERDRVGRGGAAALERRGVLLDPSQAAPDRGVVLRDAGRRQRVQHKRGVAADEREAAASPQILLVLRARPVAARALGRLEIRHAAVDRPVDARGMFKCAFCEATLNLT